MAVLVTGGSGFIGSNLVKYLSRFTEVINFDLPINDITQAKQLEDVFRLNDITQVYHLAAQAFMGPGEEDPFKDVAVNIRGMLNLLPLVEKHKASLIYTSSGAVYGNAQPPHREDKVCLPTSNYGCSKLAAEKYLQKWVYTKQINAKIVRYSSVYGPNRSHGPVNIFINKALKGEPLTVFGDGSQTRDIIHIDDAIRATEMVMGRGYRGEIYNVGTGKETSVKQVAEIISKKLDVPIEFTPHKFSVFDVKRSWYDITKLKELRYFSTTPLKMGIDTTIDKMSSKNTPS